MCLWTYTTQPVLNTITVAHVSVDIYYPTCSKYHHCGTCICDSNTVLDTLCFVIYVFLSRDHTLRDTVIQRRVNFWQKSN